MHPDERRAAELGVTAEEVRLARLTGKLWCQRHRTWHRRSAFPPVTGAQPQPTRCTRAIRESEKSKRKVSQPYSTNRGVEMQRRFKPWGGRPLLPEDEDDATPDELIRRCEECGDVIASGKRLDAEYCNPNCRARASKRRRRERETARAQTTAA